MREYVLPAIRCTLVLTILTGLIYPAAVTLIAWALFPDEASGSLVEAGGRIVGARIIGQEFTRPEYFHGRPSAGGYDGANSGGSNLGPTNRKLLDGVKANIERFRRENPSFSGPVPADIVSASASGLDPDISPAAAYAQTARIAKARGIAEELVQKIVMREIQGRFFGLLGEPRVNVLALNLALDGKH